MSGYREGRGSIFTIGIVPGMLAAIAFSYIFGLPILFGTAWGCAHRMPEVAQCSGWEFLLALGGVGAATIAVLLAVRWIVDRLLALVTRRSD